MGRSGFLAVVGLALMGWLGAVADEPSSAHRYQIAIRLTFRDEPLQLEDVRLRTSLGNTVSISRVSYLISSVEFVRADGTAVSVRSSPAWLDAGAGRDRFEVDLPPTGEYAAIRFAVGLDSASNHSDPSQYPPQHDLNPTLNRLHWTWQGGYVFLALEGRYEMAGAKLGGYSFHLGGDANRATVQVNHRFWVKPGRGVMLDFDLGRLLDAVRIAPDGSDSTHSAPNDPIAPKLKANLAAAFRFRSEFVAVAERSSTPVTKPLPAGTHAYPWHNPPNFPQPNLPADNPLTSEGVALGSKLFIEPRLSGNGRQSCSSCHSPKAAYSDRGKAFSLGIDGKSGTRNSMALFNLAWSDRYTWDGRRTLLRDQALAPIQDPREMHQSLPAAVDQLKADPEYRRLFRLAFGSPGITAERLGLALEQFLLTIVSANSKYDRAVKQEVEFTVEEKHGLLLFLTEYNPAREQFGADCFHCHGGFLFSDFALKNNGLGERGGDTGRMSVTGRDQDRDKFKTPTLRNLAATGPYMHDGRFQTLEQVVDHYDHGVRRSATLDPNIAKHPESGIHLSVADKKALIAFLKTLNDPKFTGSKP